jgi:hypothetical protein
LANARTKVCSTFKRTLIKQSEKLPQKQANDEKFIHVGQISTKFKAELAEKTVPGKKLPLVKETRPCFGEFQGYLPHTSALVP